MSMSIEYTHLKQREIMSIGLFSNFCNMSKCAVTLLQLTTLQLLDKFIKQRHKLALNLSVDFLRGCIIINVRGLVAGIQQCNSRLFIINQAIRERLAHR